MNADPLAPFYRSIEYLVFGRALERRRFAYLPRLRQARRVLILGEGDGRALARLLALAPQASYDVVELSPAMIELTRRSLARTAGASNVRFLQQDARLLQPAAAHYDAVITFFFLDCFAVPEARALIDRLARALAPGGYWLMTDFAIPARGLAHWHARLWTAIMYRFFRWTTGLRTQSLPPIEALLSAAPLTLIASESERAGMIVSQFWQKMA